MPVSGVRIDGGSGHFGYNTTIADSVAWKVGGYMIKGDYHNVTGNLALEMASDDEEDEGYGGLKVVHIRKDGYDHPMNEHSIVEDNLAWIGRGDKDLTCPRKLGAEYPMAGIKSNNYYGNYSFACGVDFDGSVVLDGKTLPDAKYTDLPDLLIDISNYDFRPKPDTILTSTGKQIGPYPAEYSNGDTYCIPGRKEKEPSFPIPSDQSVVEMRSDLIFQQAYK